MRIRILLWTACWAAAAAQAPTAAQRAAEGLRALEAGRLEAAGEAFAEATKLDPGNVDYILGLAQVRLAANDTKAAIPLLESGLRKLPGDYNVRFALAQAYLQQDQDAKAARLLTGKPPGEPLAAPWLFHRGFALFRLNDYTAALPVFESLTRYPDMRAPGSFFTANCRAALGQLAESLPAYAAALKWGNRPDNRALNAYHYNYGLALFRLGRYEEAARQFQDSSRLYAPDPMPHYFRGRSLGELARHAEAIEALEEALRLAPDMAAAAYQLARLHRDHGQAARAAELFEKVKLLKQNDLRDVFRMKTGSEK